MTSTDPNPTPKHPLPRVGALILAVLAILAAASGVIASLSVLAWVVAAIALMTFAASFYLKSGI